MLTQVLSRLQSQHYQNEVDSPKEIASPLKDKTLTQMFSRNDSHPNENDETDMSTDRFD